MRTNRRKRYKCLSSKLQTISGVHLDWAESDRNIKTIRRINSVTQEERAEPVHDDSDRAEQLKDELMYGDPEQYYYRGKFETKAKASRHYYDEGYEYDKEDYLKAEREGRGEVGNLFDELGNVENPFA